jgi:hypothetical protein
MMFLLQRKIDQVWEDGKSFGDLLDAIKAICKLVQIDVENNFQINYRIVLDGEVVWSALW